MSPALMLTGHGSRAKVFSRCLVVMMVLSRWFTLKQLSRSWEESLLPVKMAELL